MTGQRGLDNFESLHSTKTKMVDPSFTAKGANPVRGPNISTGDKKINRPTLLVSFAVNLSHLGRGDLNRRVVSSQVGLPVRPPVGAFP